MTDCPSRGAESCKPRTPSEGLLGLAKCNTSPNPVSLQDGPLPARRYKTERAHQRPLVREMGKEKDHTCPVPHIDARPKPNHARAMLLACRTDQAGRPPAEVTAIGIECRMPFFAPNVRFDFRSPRAPIGYSSLVASFGLFVPALIFVDTFNAETMFLLGGLSFGAFCMGIVYLLVEEPSIKALRKRVFEESESDEESTIAELLRGAIQKATDYESLTMAQAEARSRILFRFGAPMLVLALFAPVASYLLYTTTDNVTALARTLDDLGIEKSTVLTSEVIQTIGPRDWRILAAGFSYGALFLASAGALLKLESRHRSLALRLASRVGHYKRLRESFNIIRQLDEAKIQMTESEFTMSMQVLGMLLDEPPSAINSAAGESDSESRVRSLRDELREILGARTDST
jgi:hypothetical protein